jgi:hypothetical protein
LKVSSSVIAKTIKSYDETDSHEDRHRNGRPTVTSAAEDKFIRVTSFRNQQLNAPQVAALINASKSSSKKHISTSTVHGRIAARKPLLKDTNK